MLVPAPAGSGPAPPDPAAGPPGWLSTVEACTVYRMPRPPAGPDPERNRGDDARAQRLAALVGAYHAAAAGTGAVALGWYRPHAQGPIQVIAGGGLVGSEPYPGHRLLRLPAGGHGRCLPAGGLLATCRAVPYWTAIGAVVDTLAADAAAAAPGRPLSLEDCLLGVWTEPFAWFVFAEPVGGDEARALADRAAGEERQARGRAASSPQAAVVADRWRDRHRELRQGESTGLWRIRLLAGGADGDSALRVAGLLAAATDLTGLPYALVPGPRAGGFDERFGGGVEPLVGSSAVLAAIARGPSREIPGVRFALRPEFDTNPEVAPGTGGRIPLGSVLDRNEMPVGTLELPAESLNRHTFVCGATGAGKSQTVRHLLEQATAGGLPWLVIEPAKAEYRAMARRLAGRAEVVVLRPGDPDAVPVGINPLEPAPGFTLQTHLDLVKALFLAAFEAEEPFPQVLVAALTRCYQELGWDLALGEPVHPAVAPRYPTLGDLQRVAEQVVTDIGYGGEVRDNVRGFIKVRIASLRTGTTGRFFEGGYPLDFAALLRRNVVFEIEDVGDDHDKAFLMGTVLIRLVEYLRAHPPAAGGLRHLTVIEEAHRLLRHSDTPGPASQAVEMFAGLLAEIRAHGEGLVIAEQIPAKLIPDVIKNTAVKVVHRLPARDDRDTVGATMNLTDEQSQYLVTLRPGTAAVFTDGMDHPLLTGMPDGTERERGPAHPAPPSQLLTESIMDGRSPVTARELVVASRLLAAEPRLVLWAELAVFGHLTGRGTPQPAPDLLAELRQLPADRRELALRQAVRAAVATRGTSFATAVSPAPFTEHVLAALCGQLDGSTAGCPDEELEWLAPAYHWTYQLRALDARYQEDPRAGRHPRSDDWERSGRPVPGSGCAEQLDLVINRVRRLQSDPSVIRAAVLGTGQPSTVETVIGSEVGEPDWPDRCRQALADFDRADWALDYLDT